MAGVDDVPPGVAGEQLGGGLGAGFAGQEVPLGLSFERWGWHAGKRQSGEGRSGEGGYTGHGVVDGQVRAQLPGGVRLGEELPGFGFDGRDGVGAGDEAGRGTVRFGEGDDGGGEFCRVACLLAVHGLPCRLGGRGALGVVVDG